MHIGNGKVEIRTLNIKDYHLARQKMVQEQLVGRGIKDANVLRVMGDIPRHLFLDRELGPQAYSDHPFPIGFAQTMSQPFIVAYLAENLELSGNEVVLEIGTGSGYQAAVLAKLAKWIFSVERIPELAARAKNTIRELSIPNISIRTGDGASGWIEKSPFDRILLTAAAPGIPKLLMEQLREGGMFLGPVSLENGKQEILKLGKKGNALDVSRLRECSFVPLIRDEASLERGAGHD
jgi:protein-L-isoaspartate(D-aspartate) O-methyltransferase